MSLHQQSAIGRPGRLSIALGGVGEIAVQHSRKVLGLAALVVSVIVCAGNPRFWRRTIRDALTLQVLSSGVEATGVVAFLAGSLGVLLVVQYQVWVGQVIEARLLGPVLIAVVVRELGPLLVNILVIARSGSTIAAELALMRVSGEDLLIEGLGISVLEYLIVPRVIGLLISVVCLTFIFCATAIVAGFFCGEWIGIKSGGGLEFLSNTLSAVTMADVWNLVFKTVLPPLFTGCICCLGGLSAGETIVEVPRASRVSVQRSLVALCLISALISILTYL